MMSRPGVLISNWEKGIYLVFTPNSDITFDFSFRYQQMQNQEEEFDKLTEDDGTPVRSHPQRKRRKVKRDEEEEDTTDEEDIDEEGLEDLDLEEGEEEMGSRTIQVGDKNFTFSFAWAILYMQEIENSSVCAN